MLSHGLLATSASTRPARALGYLAGHLGGLGVAVFFAISGYLITTLLLEKQDLRAFYIRRAFRILPAAYLYLIVVSVTEPLRHGELASAALFYSNYWADRSWYTAHFWSLSIEEHFYLLWPALLVCLGVRRALIAASFLVAIIALWRPWSLAHIQLPYPALQRTDVRLDAFLFAGILAILVRGPYRALLLRILTATWFRVLSALSLFAAWTWALAGSAPAISTLIESALLPAILLSLVHWPRSPVFRVLESAPLRWMGRISYGLYLWQQLFLAPPVKAFLPQVALTFAVAAASYYWLERPILRYARAPGRNWNRQVLWNNEFFAENAERYPRLRQEV